MKRILMALMIFLLSTASMQLPVAVYADSISSNSMSILPSSAYVGMFRTILIDVKASDTATGIWETGVRADASTVPTGIWIDFDPSYVRLSNSIESTMIVYAGPAASPGTYSIAIVAAWTTIIGQHWETQTTFTLEVKAVTERNWAQNPSLLLQNPPNPTSADKWHPGVRQWNYITGENWAVSNSPDLYVNWNASGIVNLKAKSPTPNYSIAQVAHLIQGLPEGTYQPPSVTLNPQKTQINLRGAVTNVFTTFPDFSSILFTWTGVKWDLYATDTKDGRVLYVELYFVRTGDNLLWELMQPVGFRVHPGQNEVLKVYDTWDNALLAISESSESFNQAWVSMVTDGPTTWFSIDVTSFFGFVAEEYAVFFGGGGDVWDSSRSINDYNLTQVALTLEAAYYSGDVVPECSITLEDFEVKGSYLADVYIDGKIDNIDVMLVNDFLNTRLGDYNYFPNADLNLDSVIDSADLAIVTDYVGKNFPAPWLTVSINSPGGTTNPAPGTYPYSYGSSVSVTASAYSHYNFDHWVLDGATVYGNPKTVTMNSDHTLVAYFSLFNNPANTPSPPSGPTTVYRNVWYTYSTSATDPDGDRIRYHLNVTGPGNPYQNTTVWVDSGTPMNWNLLWELTDSPGAYLVQTWVEDEYGALSSMSYLSVNMVNRPPNVPATPSGPTSGIVSGTYTYSTSTIDPDGDYVYYEFDWGDGTTTTTSSYPSGATVYASHIWSLAGTYYVKVRAKDSYGTWSDWSLTLTVTINTHSGGGGGGGGRPNAPTPT